MVQYEDNFDDDSTLSLVIHPQSDRAIGQVQLSHNIISNFTRKRKLPIKTRISWTKNQKTSYSITFYQASVMMLHITVYLILKFYHRNHQINHHAEYKQMIQNHFLKNFHIIYQKNTTSNITKSKLNVHKRYFFHFNRLEVCFYNRNKWNFLTRNNTKKNISFLTICRLNLRNTHWQGKITINKTLILSWFLEIIFNLI